MIGAGGWDHYDPVIVIQTPPIRTFQSSSSLMHQSSFISLGNWSENKFNNEKQTNVRVENKVHRRHWICRWQQHSALFSSHVYHWQLTKFRLKKKLTRKCSTRISTTWKSLCTKYETAARRSRFSYLVLPPEQTDRQTGVWKGGTMTSTPAPPTV